MFQSIRTIPLQVALVLLLSLYSISAKDDVTIKDYFGGHSVYNSQAIKGSSSDPVDRITKPISHHPQESHHVLKHPAEKLTRDLVVDLQKYLSRFSSHDHPDWLHRIQSKIEKEQKAANHGRLLNVHHRWLDKLPEDKTHNIEPLAKSKELDREHDAWLQEVEHANITARLDSPKALASTLKKCWEDTNFITMFSSETCRLAWTYYMASAKVVKIDLVQESPDFSPKLMENGAMRVTFENGMKAQYKTCHGIRTESWKAELIGYAVDRLLGVDRIPAVVPRKLSWKSILSAQVGSARDAKRVAQIHEQCNNNGEYFWGVMIGWTKWPVKTLYDFTDLYLEEHTFDVKKMTHNNLEFARSLLFTYFIGHPHKVGHNIVELEDPQDKKFIIIGIDNDRGDWGQWDMTLPKGEVCNRHSTHGAFQCALENQKPSMGDVLAFFAQGCVFPARIAERLKAYHDSYLEHDRKSLRLSDALRHHLMYSAAAGQQPHYHSETFSHGAPQPPLHHSELFDVSWWGKEFDPTDFVRYNPDILNAMVSGMAMVLDSCLKRYPYNEVVFADHSHMEPESPPKAHVDPNGNVYHFDANSGIWRRVTGSNQKTPKYV